MHKSAEHVASELATLGVQGEVRELAEPAPTAAAAAAAAQLGCEVGAIANSLLFSADGDPHTALESYAVVWAGAGHVHTVFPTTFAELLRITGGTPAELS
jgi:prolyl-tRNA editing enzyme YbaK/EbsC (Cys-tRNA(Pro) deacylase)